MGFIRRETRYCPSVRERDDADSLSCSRDRTNSALNGNTGTKDEFACLRANSAPLSHYDTRSWVPRWVEDILEPNRRPWVSYPIDYGLDLSKFLGGDHRHLTFDYRFEQKITECSTLVFPSHMSRLCSRGGTAIDNCVFDTKFKTLESRLISCLSQMGATHATQPF